MPKFTNDALKFIATKVKTQGFGDGAIVVFNPLSWERKDILHSSGKQVQ